MSSLLDTLTSEELDIFERFRKSVEDILQPKHDDRFLLRWLRARNFNLHDAEEMLRKHMAWRKLTRADDILQIHKPKEVTVKYWPLGLIGADKNGCPVWLCRLSADLKGIVYSTTRSDSLSEFTYVMELNDSIITKKIREEGRKDDGAVVIIDMNHISFTSLSCVPVARRTKDLFSWFEANYPELLKSVYLINVPSFIHIIMAFVRTLLHENTFKKIHVYGKDGWKEKLVETIDEAVLPVKLGGKRMGPNNDPNCYDLVIQGGTVPRSYYIQNRLTYEDEAKTVVIKAGTSHTVEMEVAQPNSVLSWEFKTKDHDISFGLFYAENDDLEEIIASERQNCHIIPENGCLLCQKIGKYVLKFDNSYSWMRSKILSYWVLLSTPEIEQFQTEVDLRRPI